MFDFDVIMESLGFEKEPIIHAYSVCTSMIEDVREYAIHIGYENDADALCFDFDGVSIDDVFANAVKENFVTDVQRGVARDTDDLTSTVITNCVNTTLTFLEDTELFKTLNARFCGGHPLVLQFGNDETTVIGDVESLDTDSGTAICRALNEVFIDKLYTVINDSNAVKKSGREYKKEWIAEDIQRRAYGELGITNSLQYGLVGGTVIDTINARLKNEKEKSMDSRNGQYVRD